LWKQTTTIQEKVMKEHGLDLTGEEELCSDVRHVVQITQVQIPVRGYRQPTMIKQTCILCVFQGVQHGELATDVTEKLAKPMAVLW
jgi:hypothetical protein